MPGMEWRRMVLLAGFSLLLGACAGPDAGVRAGSPAGRTERERAERVARSLAEERVHFANTRDPEAVFAVFYHHVTEGVLEVVDSGRLRHPDFWLEEVVAFHAAYARNRFGGNREAHWRPYYERAREVERRGLEGWDVAGPADLLGRPGLAGLGARAHIGTDLPRALEEVARRYPRLGRDREGDLRRDFEEIARVFPVAARRAFGEMAAVMGTDGPCGLEWLPLRDEVAAWQVIRARDEAWRRFAGPRKAGRGIQPCQRPRRSVS